MFACLDYLSQIKGAGFFFIAPSHRYPCQTQIRKRIGVIEKKNTKARQLIFFIFTVGLVSAGREDKSISCIDQACVEPLIRAERLEHVVPGRLAACMHMCFLFPNGATGCARLAGLAQWRKPSKPSHSWPLL